MSGSRRMIVGAISQGKLRGKAMADELDKQLNSEYQYDADIKKKIDGTRKKK